MHRKHMQRDAQEQLRQFLNHRVRDGYAFPVWLRRSGRAGEGCIVAQNMAPEGGIIAAAASRNATLQPVACGCLGRIMFADLRSRGRKCRLVCGHASCAASRCGWCVLRVCARACSARRSCAAFGFLSRALCGAPITPSRRYGARDGKNARARAPVEEPPGTGCALWVPRSLSGFLGGGRGAGPLDQCGRNDFAFRSYLSLRPDSAQRRLAEYRYILVMSSASLDRPKKVWRCHGLLHGCCDPIGCDDRVGRGGPIACDDRAGCRDPTGCSIGATTRRA